MATWTSAGNSAHHTLAANTVDIVTLDKPYRYVEIINRDTAVALWATVDTGPVSNQATVTPTVAGDGSYFVGPGDVRVIADDARTLAVDTAADTSAASTVRLISTGAVAYSVTGYGLGASSE